MANRITIGNSVISGFVNFVEGKRLVVGTGSYTPKGGEKVFKESITVFADDAFNGAIPAKGDYVKVSGDVVVSPRKDKPEELQVTMNVRFANQLVKAEAPKKAESTEGAPANSDDI
ncbi:uncharacterized protein NMK_2157 [Novimethylophilus kurashikiensis]|uniref:Uncharacterized protein n=1 Tax=Novimethylophilus kurashikiensis TaxID=1825523 RepID=A0A2R5FAI2_9PROT|nr:hypothetical protein [Novimethylophilus kurashikiensis]GBG14558.1 uncharacterized protein NMK_2157 [Novimethylophilus kurashikiensis]